MTKKSNWLVSVQLNQWAEVHCVSPIRYLVTLDSNMTQCLSYGVLVFEIFSLLCGSSIFFCHEVDFCSFSLLLFCGITTKTRTNWRKDIGFERTEMPLLTSI